MQVSVVIPVLNEASRIATAVERAWAAGADEVIVCDGGSVDETRHLVAELRCRQVVSPQGRGIQQNRGAQVAEGEGLLFLHADTWLPANGISQVRDALSRPHCLGGCFYQRIVADAWWYRLLERGNAARARLWMLPFGDQGLFFRRTVFDQLGGFPEIPLMEDVRMMRRFRKIARPALLCGPLYVDPRRWQRRGVLSQTLRNWCLLSAEKLGATPERLARYYSFDKADRE